MAQRPSVNWNKLSTASKILLVAGLLLFIDLFLAWQKVCAFGFCGSASGWHGWGVLVGILVIAILAMEVVILLNVNVTMGTPQMRNQVEAALCGGVLLFTIIKFFVDNAFRKWPAWLGLILAIVIAYGGFMRWQESTVSTPPPATPGGGFAA